jgi:hypothetical protein
MQFLCQSWCIRELQNSAIVPDLDGDSEQELGRFGREKHLFGALIRMHQFGS